MKVSFQAEFYSKLLSVATSFFNFSFFNVCLESQEL